MKKKLLPLFALGVATFSMAIGVSQNVYRKADASINPYVLLKDDFNDSTYKGTVDDSKWVSKTATENAIHQSINSDCYLDNNTSSGNVETTAICTNRMIKGTKSFQFDIRYSEAARSSGKWSTVYFANEYQDMFSGDALAYAGLMSISHNAIFSFGSSFDKSNFNYEVLGAGTSLVDTWLTIKLTITGSTTGTLNVCLQGGTFDAANVVNFTYNHGVDLLNAYVGISVSNEAGEVRLDNFILENSGETLSEDFSHCDPTDPESDFIYKVTEKKSGDLSFCTFTIIDNCTLDFDEAENGDYIYSKAVVEDPSSIVTDMDVIDLSFNVNITQKNYKLGIVFGYNAETNDIYKNTVIYEINKYTGRLYEYDENGNQLLPEETNTNNFTSVVVTSTINILVNKSSGLSVTENGTQVSYNGQTVSFSPVSHYYGSIALVLLERGKNTPVVCSIDQLKLITNTYYIPVTKSVTHNFSNDYWGNADKPDFYLRNPSGAGEQTVKDGKLVWSMASDGTFFGSAHQYDNFILDFKITSIYGDISESESTSITAKNKWIGLDLSRSTLEYSEYSSYVNILTVITPEESYETAPVWVNCSSSSPLKAEDVERKNFNQIPRSMFDDITYSDESAKGEIKAEDAVCFRYVSEGGNITMYLKKACEMEFTKIMTLYNLQLKGYFALCCTGYTFLEIDDFSMSNTSPVYECADNDVPETIIETVTEVIYDNQNNPINLEEELRINAGSGIFLVLTIVFAATTIVAGGVIVLLVVKGKKGKKHEENR